jgi:hypothetical protein
MHGNPELRSDCVTMILSAIFLLWKRTPTMLSFIVRMVRTILTILKWRKIIMVEFDKKAAFAEETKTALIAALKESEEFVAFVEHVEEIVIAHLQDKSNWWQKLLVIGTEVAQNLQPELIAAVTGIAGIPAEWKAAPKDAWIEFAVEFLVSEGKIISAVWKKPTV